MGHWSSAVVPRGLINYFKGEDENYDFLGTGFLAYFSGMLFETAGEWNDAYISYKQAAEYYQNAAEKTGVEMPDDIGNSLVRLARRLGFTLMILSVTVNSTANRLNILKTMVS